MSDTIIMYENGKAIGGEGHPTNADEITFDNSNTNLVSEEVESAIKEVNAKGTPRTDIATVESGTTASRAYSVGELVYVGGTLYRVKTTIASGATFTVGTNIEVTNVSDVIGLKQDKVTDSGWIALGSYLKYRKIGDIVSVKVISNGYSVNTSSWTTLGTLPSGYRPNEVSVYCAIINEPQNNYYLSVQVDYDGNVKVIGTIVGLFQITFIL